jgi:hypothetical protein
MTLRRRITRFRRRTPPPTPQRDTDVVPHDQWVAGLLEELRAPYQSALERLDNQPATGGDDMTATLSSDRQILRGLERICGDKSRANEMFRTMADEAADYDRARERRTRTIERSLTADIDGLEAELAAILPTKAEQELSFERAVALRIANGAQLEPHRLPKRLRRAAAATKTRPGNATTNAPGKARRPSWWIDPAPAKPVRVEPYVAEMNTAPPTDTSPMLRLKPDAHSLMVDAAWQATVETG